MNKNHLKIENKFKIASGKDINKKTEVVENKELEKDKQIDYRATDIPSESAKRSHKKKLSFKQQKSIKEQTKPLKCSEYAERNTVAQKKLTNESVKQHQKIDCMHPTSSVLTSEYEIKSHFVALPIEQDLDQFMSVRTKKRYKIGNTIKKLNIKLAGKKKTKEKRSRKERLPYIYDMLESIILQKKNRCNFYAIILTCSSPICKNALQYYSCNAKLIDTTVNSHSRFQFLTAVFVSKIGEELPKPEKVGSIIRVHRGKIQEHGGKVFVNCSIAISSWILFDPIATCMPISKSSKNYTWVDKDYSRLAELKKYSIDYLKNYKLDSVYLANAAQFNKEFDAVCVIIKVKGKMKNTFFQLLDQSKSVKLKVDSKAFPSFRPQDVVLLRSAKYLPSTNFKYITFSDYSNLLKIPIEFYSAKYLNNELKTGPIQPKIKLLLNLYYHQFDKENLITKATNLPRKATPVFLQNLQKEAAKRIQKFFKVSIYALETSPNDCKQWICYTYPEKRETLDCRQNLQLFEADGKSKPKEFYYKFQIFAKDKHAQYDTSIYVLFLCTIDGRGSEFINIGTIKNIGSKDHIKKLETIYTFITRPWNYLDVILEAVEVGNKLFVFFIIDTQINISLNQ